VYCDRSMSVAPGGGGVEAASPTLFTRSFSMMTTAFCSTRPVPSIRRPKRSACTRGAEPAAAPATQAASAAVTMRTSVFLDDIFIFRVVGSAALSLHEPRDDNAEVIQHR